MDAAEMTQRRPARVSQAEIAQATTMADNSRMVGKEKSHVNAMVGPLV
jgi:hypothetical protein